MNLANVETFYQEVVVNNEELQQQIGATQDLDSFKKLVVQLGQENGYAFTIEEVNAFINQTIQKLDFELSDKELESVAGGCSCEDDRCPIDTRLTVCFLKSGCWGSVC